MSVAIVPMFLQALATQGTSLALEIGGGIAGVLLGIAAVSMMSIRREAATGRLVTRRDDAHPYS